jgi:carboxymethylenebutenolidase
MNRWTWTPRAAWPLAMLALVVACTERNGAEASLDAAADSAPPRGVQMPVPDSLPAAVLGTAPPPRGTSIHYDQLDPAANGYLVIPEGEGPFPAVILIHEWDGLVDRVRPVADAMADEGYVALAADLYSGRTGSSPEENRALVEEVRGKPERMIANLDAAASLLRARPDVNGRLATMGWCFGGGVALSYGIGGKEHEGTAMFYGQLVTDPEQLARLRHPLYGTFAGLDDGIPPEEVARFVDALREAGIENDVHVYDGVGHGFWLYVDEDPAARAAPALDAWRRLHAYLARTVKS